MVQATYAYTLKHESLRFVSLRNATYAWQSAYYTAQKRRFRDLGRKLGKLVASQSSANKLDGLCNKRRSRPR